MNTESGCIPSQVRGKNPHTEINRVTWRNLDRVVQEGFPEEVVFKQRPAGQDEEPRDRKEWEKIDLHGNS